MSASKKSRRWTRLTRTNCALATLNVIAVSYRAVSHCFAARTPASLDNPKRSESHLIPSVSTARKDAMKGCEAFLIIGRARDRPNPRLMRRSWCLSLARKPLSLSLALSLSSLLFTSLFHPTIMLTLAFVVAFSASAFARDYHLLCERASMSRPRPSRLIFTQAGDDCLGPNQDPGTHSQWSSGHI